MILVILSCSGFRIDNLAMTDVSKRNFLPPGLPGPPSILHLPMHRLRHHRNLRPRPHSTHRDPHQASGHIEVRMLPPNAPLGGRSRRSQRKTRWSPSQEEDVSSRAFGAEVVLQAVAESGSKPRYMFVVRKAYKNATRFAFDSRVLVTVPADRKGHRPRNPASNKIQLGKRYILFLNASSPHNYSLLGAPKLVTERKLTKVEGVLRRVCNATFGKCKDIKLVFGHTKNMHFDLHYSTKISSKNPITVRAQYLLQCQI